MSALVPEAGNIPRVSPQDSTGSSPVENLVGAQGIKFVQEFSNRFRSSAHYKGVPTNIYVKDANTGVEEL